MKLKQIATIRAGYPFRGKIPEVKDSAVVAVQMKDISLTEGILWSGCIETELTGKREPDYLTVGDILLAARGSHNYAVQVDDSLVSTGKRAVAAPHFFMISPRQNSMLAEFLVWLLNQAPAQRYFEQNAEGTLTKSIRRSVLEDTPLVVPPLAKQRAIVALANTLREEQKLIQSLVSNGERMMSAIAKDLFDNKGAR
ncbi:restriction endonuclease subunit S [Limnobacter profundi]|uniref:Restriction endonuclease subunit S n=1 Tax=Limnobacter profundi TaxID=2732163 RepID=A0ABX6N463_9BURK|nr:restriction endonuclease subunit S [Limnobacter sp. SAORIC-580]QJR29176.1 restriction endonuclease subunit S [Limnobacter sp. SAORIC-580]